MTAFVRGLGPGHRLGGQRLGLLELAQPGQVLVDRLDLGGERVERLLLGRIAGAILVERLLHHGFHLRRAGLALGFKRR